MSTSESVLIVKLGAIGDVVLSLPMIQATRAAHPGARVTVMIGQASAPLLKENTAVDDVWVVDENDFWKKRLRRLLQLFLEVRSRRFSQVYILQWSSLFHFFFWLAGIPKRVGFSREGQSFKLTHSVPYFEGDARHHDVDLYLRLVGSASGAPTLAITSMERIQGEARWGAFDRSKTRPRVVMAPGGGHNAKLVMPLKRWSAAHFSALAKKLEKEWNAIVLLAGSSSEKTLLDSIGLPTEQNLAGHLDLRDTAALIATAGLFIGNDSGLTHIAAAVGTPSLVFFGPTSPYGKESRVTPQRILYRQEPCSPCYRFGSAPPCPYDMKCLTQISPDDAWAAVETLRPLKTA
jgi:lipopolysaccharide heptosyltransferase II